MSVISRRQLLGAVGVGAIATACGGGRSRGKPVRKKSSSANRFVESYGSDPLQVGEWFVPSGQGVAPTVILVHGGFWSPQYDRSLENNVALDLVGRGYLVWNIDYRSAAAPWPATLTDVAAAYDFVPHGKFASRVDHTRLAVVGHSAGGQLVAWLASRHLLPPTAPGHNPTVKPPTLCIPQAGVVALTDAARENLGGGAPQAFVHGTPQDEPERYRQADPLDLLPSGVRTVLVHDRHDAIVPLSQSQTYVAAATKAGDNSTLVIVPGNHFSHIDPTSVACAKMRDALATMT